MLSLLILIIFGLGAAYFATQNTGLVHLIFGNYLFSGIPLYVVIIGAMLLGVFISWLLSMINSVSSFMTLHSKDSMINEERKKVNELKKKNEELSLELARLKGKEREHVDEDEHILSHPSLFQRFKSSIA